MTNDDLGTIEANGEGWRLTLVRRFDAPIDQVWAAITEPDRLADWLSETKIEPCVGGKIEIDFGPDEVAGGEVLAFDPPHAFEFEWERRSGGVSSIVRFELASEGRGTVLTLIHRRQSARTARSTCAGWHAHLDGLLATLGGEPVEWDGCYAKARPRYEPIVAEIG